MTRIFEHVELDIGYDDLDTDTQPDRRLYVAPDVLSILVLQQS